MRVSGRKRKSSGPSRLSRRQNWHSINCNRAATWTWRCRTPVAKYSWPNSARRKPIWAGSANCGKATDSLVSEQQVEQQTVLVDVARSEQQAAEISLKKLQQALEFQFQTAQAERQAAERGLRLAEAGSGLKTLEQQKRLAEIKLQQTRVLAPITGTVLNVFAHAGEVVTQSPLLQIADLDNLVCLTEVDATDLQRLSIGQKARVSSRAFRGPFPDTTVDAVIERFGSLVARAALQPLDPRKPVDRHVVQVVVAVDAQEILKRIFGDDAQDPTALVGLQVEVRFSESSAGPAAAL